MKKRLLQLGFAAAALLAVCACKKPAPSETPEKTPEKTAWDITIPAGPEGEAMLTEMFGPFQNDFSLNIEPRYIGSNQTETEYAVIDPEDGVSLTEEEIARIDVVFKAIEDLTGLSFLNGRYGIGKKITIHVYQEIGSCCADNMEKSIFIERSCLNESFLTMAHELIHILELSQVYTGGFGFYSEGYAEYWTYKLADYILKNDCKELIPCIDLDAYSNKWVYITQGKDYKMLYDRDITHWMEQGCYYAFKDSWPAYIYGRFFFQYLEDTYGDVTSFLDIYARIECKATGEDLTVGVAGRRFMDLDPYIKMMQVTYGGDVFDGFYPWMKNHEELFEQYKNQ